MKKIVIIFVTLITVHFAHGQRARLPDQFYFFDKTNLFNPEEKKHGIFFIVVPAAAESAQKNNTLAQELKKFTANNTLTVPYSFFSANNPAKTTSPLCVYFDWIDSSPSFNHLNTPAQKLAEGLDYLYSLDSKCIVVTQGRGALVFNAATHKLKHPIEVAIQVGPTIPQDRKKHISFMPHPNKIGKLYTFYSQQPFKLPKPTLQPRYVKEYPNLIHPDHHSVLLLINNRQPQQKELNTSLVGKNLLSLCYEIKKQFKINRDLFACLSTLKKETNMLVAIRNLAKTQTTERTLEILYSNEQKKRLISAWKRAPELVLSKAEITRNKHRYKNT